MGLRGGETPLAILFFFSAKSVTFPGVFFIDVIYFQKVPHYDPLVGVCATLQKRISLSPFNFRYIQEVTLSFELYE